MAAAPCVRRIRRDRMLCCATVAVALVLRDPPLSPEQGTAHYHWQIFL